MTELERLVARLYVTREARKAAKQAFREASAKEVSPDGPGCDYCGEDGQHHCSQSTRPIKFWCDYCKARQPAWEAYQKAVNTAGGALRAVLREGKLLAAQIRKDGAK